MPNISNIIVKKSDGTTDVTYTALNGAGSDGTPAIFRNNTVGTMPSERPSLAVTSRWNGPRTARRVTLDFAWPIVSTDAGGRKSVTGKTVGSASFLAPQDQDAATIKEQAYQFGNLIAASLIKASFEEGLAPRG